MRATAGYRKLFRERWVCARDCEVTCRPPARRLNWFAEQWGMSSYLANDFVRSCVKLHEEVHKSVTQFSFFFWEFIKLQLWIFKYWDYTGLVMKINLAISCSPMVYQISNGWFANLNGSTRIPWFYFQRIPKSKLYLNFFLEILASSGALRALFLYLLDYTYVQLILKYYEFKIYFTF